MTSFGRQHNHQNYNLASSSPYTVRDLRAGGMHIGITDCRQAKQWFPPFAKKISFELLRKGRKEFSKAVQLITGHNFLQRHTVIVQEDADPLRRSCGEDGEVVKKPPTML